MPALARETNSKLVFAAQLALAAGLALLAAHILFGFMGNGYAELFDHWLYDGLMTLAAVVCLSRVALVPEERGAWLLIGLGLCGWALGDIYWTAALADMSDPPFPSLADAGYLAFYPLAFAGLFLLLRSRMRNVTTATWLDGLIVALAITSLGTELLLDVVLDNAGVNGLSLITAMAYPVGDILVLALAAALLVLTGGVPGRAWTLIVAGLAVTAFADAAYSYTAYQGTYVEGSWIDLLWPVGAALVAVAAWESPPCTTVKPRHGWRALAVPAGFTVLVAGRIALHPVLAVNPAGMVVAAVLLAVIVVRIVVTMAENEQLLSRVETDPLTGLANRGKLLEDLRDAIASRRPQCLALYDLDGFKLYNDTFGHPAGDALLGRLGARLASCLPEGGTAYRVGGDEFCVLLPAPVGAGGAAQRAAAALGETGQGFEVTSSFGAISIPEEARDPVTALQLADKRMYAQKDSRRTSAGGQAKAVLLRAMRERQPDLGKHVDSVSALAIEVGRRLGLQRGEMIALSNAAELHDVGKVAIPDAILAKPGRLDDQEWEFIRQHTILGERIICSAPALAHVAPIVRSSHEHYDGSGYPDGLAGEAIPLASRIIFACDAYEAMTSERSYAVARSPQDAIRELRRCAGTQFDPRIVEPLCSLLEETSGRAAVTEARAAG